MVWYLRAKAHFLIREILPVHLMVGCFPLEEVIGVRVPDRQLTQKSPTFVGDFCVIEVTTLSTS